MTKRNRTVGFDEDLLKEADRLAQKENRSFNNWLQWIMMKAIEEEKKKVV